MDVLPQGQDLDSRRSSIKASLWVVGVNNVPHLMHFVSERFLFNETVARSTQRNVKLNGILGGLC